MRNLIPQSPDRVHWEIDVAEALALRLECNYTDAAGIMDTVPDFLDALFAAGTAPADAADTVDTLTLSSSHETTTH
jgi:hypothetical protein